jgi:hypothetical protein
LQPKSGSSSLPFDTLGKPHSKEKPGSISRVR